MNTNWIAVWGCAVSRPSRRLCSWMKDITVRMNMLMTVSGDALRFHFTNRYGVNEVTITRATVAPFVGDRKIDVSRLAHITFAGNESGVMAPFSDITSDEIPFEFKAGETICVNLYFGDFTEMSTANQNSGRFIENWVVSGDRTAEAELPVNENAPAECYPFIHTVDAECAEECYSVIAFGDSITAQTWPDRFACRLLKEGREDVAVIRRGIGGNRVLRKYECDFLTNYGDSGIERFESSVVAAGVKKVFVLHGINDIIHPERNGNIFRPITDQPTPEELIDGYKKYIEIARKHGFEIYQSAILPFKGWKTYNEEKEQIRQDTNRWIYHNDLIDGVLPFEAAVQNEQDPLVMVPAFDSGDHLHPSGAGAQAMADSIPAEFFAPKGK